VANQAHFRLQVANAALSRIEVTAGRVTVKHGESTVATLEAGQVLVLAPAELTSTRGPVSSAEPSGMTLDKQAGLRHTGGAPDDNAFAEAFHLLGVGLPEEAAAAFDALLARGALDASRRADVLYWSCQAHARAGDAVLAETRARAYISRYPSSLHYGDVALLLGDYARGRGANTTASDYYARALRAAHPATRAKAQESLRLMGHAN
jgi:TolA-binding protein